ncbi:peptidoglycan-binding protein [soil metagenome]
MADQDTVPVRGRGHAIRRWVIGATIIALLVAGGVAAGAYAAGMTAAPASQKRQDAATAQIARGTLSGTSKATGTLEYAGSHDLASQLQGVITGLPVAGAQVGIGQQLYAVDNIPVFLFHGTLPVWRAFEYGMDDGPDITQLEDNLKALGYFAGDPDAEFGWSTSNAIEAWQQATGQPVTGSIEAGRIVFRPTDLRVSAVKADLGSSTGPGSPVIAITSLDKQIRVELRLADQKLAKVGGPVSVELPGGAPATGTIAAVGVPTEVDGQNGQKTVVIPVVVTLDDPAVAGDLQEASVVVDFPSETREDVLSVPVEALLALPGSTFGVEIVGADGTTRRVPVTTGLFAGGRVEISGDGISEGDNVVVPSV